MGYIVCLPCVVCALSGVPAHNVPGIGLVCNYFYQEWLPKSSERKMDEGLLMEYYPETFPQDLIIYLHFPIKYRTT